MKSRLFILNILICSILILPVNGNIEASLSNSSKSPDFILISDKDIELIPMIAPVASKVKRTSLPYFLITDPNQTQLDMEKMIRILNYKNPLRIITDSNLSGDGNSFKSQVLKVKSTYIDAGFDIARHFWGKAETLVMAGYNEPEAVIQASCLAAVLQVPLIPVNNMITFTDIYDQLNGLGTQKIIFVKKEESQNPVFMDYLRIKSQIISCSDAQQIIITLLHKEQIKNVIVARIPSDDEPVSSISWMSCYLSLFHDSPVLLTDTSDGIETEKKISEFIDSFNINPRSVTILGGTELIERILVQDRATLEEYEVYVDPGSRKDNNLAALRGVGRLPFSDIPRLSVYLAGDLKVINKKTSSPLQVVMVANSNPDQGPLPLAETVSMATASEFKNFSVDMHEFYGVPSYTHQVIEYSSNANLIIYEGHLYDQYIFRQYIHYDDYYPDEYDSPIDFNNFENWDQSWHDDEYSINNTPVIEQVSYNGVKHETVKILAGSPVVILQSCHSLEQDTADRIFELGGIGILGTTTNVHSASGSTFVKSFCDNLLYDKDTVGQALCDARNYYLCMADLKSKRGHSQQAKAYRVALSFSYWGDPEVFIPQVCQLSSLNPPVSAVFAGEDTIQIITPKKTLRTITTEKYQIRMFPGSQLAGIVKRLTDKDYRRLMPLYFFKLTKPAGFDIHRFSSIKSAADDSIRATFMDIPSSNEICIIYFPEKINPNETIILQFQ